MTENRVWRGLGVAVSIVLGGASLSAQSLDYPPDRLAPGSQQECSDLYGEYRVLIRGLREQAQACNAERPDYVQQRYGHHAGEGECARRTVSQCRGLVEDCSRASIAALAALDRCRAALSPSD